MSFIDYLKEELTKVSDEPESLENEVDYENDCFITSTPMRGYGVSCAGKYLGNFKEFDDALKAVEDWKDKNKFYPTTWHVSDHGNLMPIDSKGNEIKENYKPIKKLEKSKKEKVLPKKTKIKGY